MNLPRGQTRHVYVTRGGCDRRCIRTSAENRCSPARTTSGSDRPSAMLGTMQQVVDALSVAADLLRVEAVQLFRKSSLAGPTYTATSGKAPKQARGLPARAGTEKASTS